MSVVDILAVIVGLVLLFVGGEWLVRGAASLALRVGMSTLVVGLTVVAFATSAPELAVSVDSVLSGESDLAVGNIVGSNIANVLLILGVSAAIVPLLVSSQLIRMDIPIMIGFSVVFMVMAFNGAIGRWEGLILVVLLIGYVVMSVMLARKEGKRVLTDANGATASEESADHEHAPDNLEIDADNPASVTKSILFIAGGVGLLVVGAHVLVSGAVGIATSLGVSELVVGLTVVAIGTSLPELATSVVAVRRGERNLAIGNVVGSCIFNIGIVLGVVALISPTPLGVPESAVRVDIPVMVATAVVLLPIAFIGFTIGRWEGWLFLGMYTAYTVYLILSASNASGVSAYSRIMLWFVLPLIALAIAGFFINEIRRRRLQSLRG